MPTEAKREDVKHLAERLRRASVAIATDFSGLSVNQMTELRRHLREQGVEYKVVKNRIAALAADEAGIESFRRYSKERRASFWATTSPSPLPRR